jgi:tRNA pseudouridine38-40 synthase
MGRFTTWINRPVDAEAMREALEFAIGTHDFSAFARVRPEQIPVRDVRSVTVEQDGPLIRVGITANAFLHNMVRALVGSALEVGYGRKTPQWFGNVLESRERNGAGDVAGPQGLCLVDVEYPDVTWDRRPDMRWPYASFRELTGAAK